MTEVKDMTVLKAAREKSTHIQGNPQKAISWFLCRNFACQKGVAWYIQSSEKEKSATRILCPTRLSFRIEREMNIFSDKQKLNEFINTKPTLK